MGQLFLFQKELYNCKTCIPRNWTRPIPNKFATLAGSVMNLGTQIIKGHQLTRRPWPLQGQKWSNAISSPESLDLCRLMPTWQSWPFQRDCWACHQPSCLGDWKWRRRRTMSGRAATPSALASGVLGYGIVSIFQSEVFTDYSSSVINRWGRAGFLNWFGRLPREDNYL